MDLNDDGYLDRAEIAAWLDEAGVFNRLDENEDSVLEPTELDDGVFHLWDLDDDDRISFSEWDVTISDWYPRDLDYLSFSDWDLDGNSTLSMPEVEEGLEFTGWNRLAMDDDPKLTFDDFVDAYFRVWDRDGDGLIDIAEFHRAWQNLVFP